MSLNSLPFSALRTLDTEDYKFYDRSNRLYDALLTMCYTRHARRPVIDSKFNHIGYFNRIPFSNEEMQFTDVYSIFSKKTNIIIRQNCLNCLITTNLKQYVPFLLTVFKTIDDSEFDK